MNKWEAIVEIEQLIKRYAMNTDTTEAEDSAFLFIPNGELISPLGTFRGRKQIQEHIAEVASTVAKDKRHVVSNIMVTVQGENATSTSYMLVYDALDSTRLILTSMYKDDLVLSEGKWLFKSRNLTIDASLIKSAKKPIQQEIF